MNEQHYKIMLVDDDEFLLDMYSVKFKDAGYQVTALLSGEEALTKLRGGEKPDILMFDMIMPGIDGLTLLKTIHEENLRDGMVVIALSNEGQEKQVKEAQTLGVDGYIVKASAIPSEVLQQVNALMKEKGENK